MSPPDPSDEQLAELGITREQWRAEHKVYVESMRKIGEFATCVSRMAYDEKLKMLELGVVAALLMRSAVRETGNPPSYFMDLVEGTFKIEDATPS